MKIIIEGAIRAKVDRSDCIPSVREIAIPLPHGASIVARCDEGMEVNYQGMARRQASSTGMIYDLEHLADGTLVDHSVDPPAVVYRKVEDELSIQGIALHAIEHAMANNNVGTVRFGGLTITRGK